MDDFFFLKNQRLPWEEILCYCHSRKPDLPNLFFYARKRRRFLDVETNLGSGRPIRAVLLILCSNVRGLAMKLSDLTVASSQYDILLCSETLVSEMRHVAELLVPRFSRPVLLCRGKMPRARGMDAYVRDGDGAFRQQKFGLVFGFVVWDRTSMCSVSPDMDDRIFDYLLTSIAAVQAEGVRASLPCL